MLKKLSYSRGICRTYLRAAARWDYRIEGSFGGPEECLLTSTCTRCEITKKFFTMQGQNSFLAQCWKNGSQSSYSKGIKYCLDSFKTQILTGIPNELPTLRSVTRFKVMLQERKDILSGTEEAISTEQCAANSQRIGS